MATFFLAGALISVYVSGVAVAKDPMFEALPGPVSPQSPKAQEFEGIHQVLDVLGNTNVYRIDRKTNRSFQEFFDQKDTITRQDESRPSISSRGSVTPKAIRGIQAPKKLDTRAF